MSNLVTERQPCSEQEKEELLAYLRVNSHIKEPVQMMEAGCPLEKGKVKGIAELFAIEEEIRGRPPQRRLAVRAERSVPLLAQMKPASRRR